MQVCVCLVSEQWKRQKPEWSWCQMGSACQRHGFTSEGHVILDLWVLGRRREKVNIWPREIPQGEPVWDALPSSLHCEQTTTLPRPAAQRLYKTFVVSCTKKQTPSLDVFIGCAAKIRLWRRWRLTKHKIQMSGSAASGGIGYFQGCF